MFWCKHMQRRHTNRGEAPKTRLTNYKSANLERVLPYLFLGAGAYRPMGIGDFIFESLMRLGFLVFDFRRFINSGGNSIVARLDFFRPLCHHRHCQKDRMASTGECDVDSVSGITNVLCAMRPLENPNSQSVTISCLPSTFYSYASLITDLTKAMFPLSSWRARSYLSWYQGLVRVIRLGLTRNLTPASSFPLFWSRTEKISPFADLGSGWQQCHRHLPVVLLGLFISIFPARNKRLYR